MDRSCRTGSSRCNSGSHLLSFIWFVWGSRRDYLAFCPYMRCLFMVDGSSLYHRNRRPFCHSSPIRNLSPFPDGWGSWLHGWFFCMSGICTISEIFWLLCSNRRSWTGRRPLGASEAVFCGCFACSSSALRSAMVCLRLSACAFRCSALAVRVWVTLEVKSRTPSDTCVFPW